VVDNPALDTMETELSTVAVEVVELVELEGRVV
jgi:hypothetical protein